MAANERDGLRLSYTSAKIQRPSNPQVHLRPLGYGSPVLCLSEYVSRTIVNILGIWTYRSEQTAAPDQTAPEGAV